MLDGGKNRLAAEKRLAVVKYAEFQSSECFTPVKSVEKFILLIANMPIPILFI